MENVPAVQATQLRSVVAVGGDSLIGSCPGAHVRTASHAKLPACALKKPAAHLRQLRSATALGAGAPGSGSDPAGQMVQERQGVAGALPSARYVPLVHGAHRRSCVDEGGRTCWVPAAQSRHARQAVAPRRSAKVEAGQGSQGVSARLSASCVPSAQGMHGPTAPAAAYDPALHSTHVLFEPRSDVPAAHGRQLRSAVFVGGVVSVDPGRQGVTARHSRSALVLPGVASYCSGNAHCVSGAQALSVVRVQAAVEYCSAVQDVHMAHSCVCTLAKVPAGQLAGATHVWSPLCRNVLPPAGHAVQLLAEPAHAAHAPLHGTQRRRRST